MVPAVYADRPVQILDEEKMKSEYNEIQIPRISQVKNKEMASHLKVHIAVDSQSEAFITTKVVKSQKPILIKVITH